MTPPTAPTGPVDVLALTLLRTCLRAGLVLGLGLVLGVSWTDHTPPPQNPMPIQVLESRR